MRFQKILLPAGGVVLVAAAYRAYGWAGVALVVGALVMWLLLHYNRVMHVLRRATQRPIGFVDSAVMLNAKLKSGVNLLHVMALTRSLGELLSEKDHQPELFRWTDASDSSVTCEFQRGRLVRWELKRPIPADETAGPPPAP
jgi:hypothetical protein